MTFQGVYKLRDDTVTHNTARYEKKTKQPDSGTILPNRRIRPPSTIPSSNPRGSAKSYFSASHAPAPRAILRRPRDSGGHGFPQSPRHVSAKVTSTSAGSHFQPEMPFLLCLFAPATRGHETIPTAAQQMISFFICRQHTSVMYVSADDWQ